MLNKLFDTLLKNIVHVVLAVLILIAASLAWKFYKDSQTANQKYQNLLGTTQDYKQIKNTLASLQVDYSNQANLKKQEEKDWAAEKKYLQGQIVALANTTVGIPAHTTEGSATVNLWDTTGEIRGPAVGGVIFLVSSNGSYATSSYTNSASIEVNSIANRLNNGRYQILSKAYWILNPDDKADPWAGKKWPLDITGGSLVIDPVVSVPTLTSKFQYAPHLGLGGFVGVEGTTLTYGPRIEGSLWGYGKTQNDLDFKIVAIGANIGGVVSGRTHLDFNVVPLEYHVPLFSNLYLGAGAGIGASPSPTYFLSLEGTL